MDPFTTSIHVRHRMETTMQTPTGWNQKTHRQLATWHPLVYRMDPMYCHCHDMLPHVISQCFHIINEYQVIPMLTRIPDQNWHMSLPHQHVYNDLPCFLPHQCFGQLPLALLFQFSNEHLFVIMSLFLVLFFSVYISMPYLLDPQLASKGFISVVCFPAWFKNPLWPLFLVTFFICIISHVLSIDEIIKKI